jgi:xylulokinase
LGAGRTIDDTRLLVGIDVGTTNIKALVYDADGRSVAQASVPTTTHYPQPLWAYYEPEELWNSVCKVLQETVRAVDDPRRIAAIAVASMAEAGVPLDSAGDQTYDAIAWFDRRTIPQMEWLKKTIGEAALFEVTGLSLQPIFTLCKLLWIRENHPVVWERTTRWLMIADYIAFRLSNQQATDYSLASRALAFDLADREWATGLLESLGIHPGVMAPAVQSGTAVGAVTGEAARRTGLPEGTIVGAGGHDHVCGAFAAGVVQRGQMLDSMGTAEALFFPRDEPITDPAIGQMGYTQGAHVVSGKYYVNGGIYSSGASTEWLRDILGHIDYAELIAGAASVPAGSLGVTFVPHLRLSNTPHPDSNARAAFLGLTSDVTRAVLMRAVYEGLGYEARATIEPVLSFSSLDAMPEISVIGGGSRNDLLLKIKSSILNAPLQIVDHGEATSLGAAMLGGLAAGVYRNTDHALESVRSHPRFIHPDEDQASLYDRYFREIYAGIYDTLKPLNHRIHDLTVCEQEQDRG